MCQSNVLITTVATTPPVGVDVTIGSSITARVSEAIPQLALNGLKREAYRAVRLSLFPGAYRGLRRNPYPGWPAL